MSNPVVRCSVCGDDKVVTLNPKPLCAYHKEPPVLFLGAYDFDGEVEVHDWDEYNIYNDFDIPIYPI